MSSNRPILLAMILLLSLHPIRCSSNQPINCGNLEVKMSDPIIVAQAETAKLPWGVWERPEIINWKADKLAILYQTVKDVSSLSTEERKPRTICVSEDYGRTWLPTSESFARRGLRTECLLSNGDILYLEFPPTEDMPKEKLPPAFPAGLIGQGFQIRDPLKMPERWGQWYIAKTPAGRDQWQLTAVSVDNKDHGILCYDHPDKPDATVEGQNPMQVIELPDGSLLAIFYGLRLGPDRKPELRCKSWCLKSTDGGLTWKFHGIIASDDTGISRRGFMETNVSALSNGKLLAVIRTRSGMEGPMYYTHSVDGGKTWDNPKELHPFGVLPRLLTLDNGVTVVSFGRPGSHLLFTCDGEKWHNLTSLVGDSGSGYTDIHPIGPDSFLAAYDQFDYPNKKGEPRKTILVRKVVVSTKGKL